MKIRKREFNFWWDSLGFSAMILLVSTAHIVDDVAPNLNGGSYLLLGEQTWRNLHGLLGITLIVFVVVHILLHWKWIFARLRNSSSKSDT